MSNYKLTKREKEIFILLKKGKTNQEIADDLGVSKNTVITILYRAYKKYDIKNRTELSWRIK